MTPNTQIKHQEEFNQSPEALLVRGVKIPRIGGVTFTKEEMKKRIQEYIALTDKVAIIVDKDLEEIEEKRKLNGHLVPDSHPTVQKINKYKEQFKTSPEDLKLLNGMKVIAEDELELANGIVVKLGYPDVKADGKEIFEQILKDENGKEIRAVYFTNNENTHFFGKNALEKYLKKMEKEGFRIAGNKNDKDGKIFVQEMMKIFDQFPGKGSPNYTNIIIDILGRIFSGEGRYGIFDNIYLKEYFWSYRYWYCYMFKMHSNVDFGNCLGSYGYGILLFKDNKN